MKRILILIIFVLFQLAILLAEQKEVIDELGRRVVLINYPPQRVVSLAPSITELIFALGQSNKLVGVTNYCNKPKEAMKIKKVGGFSDPNIELIVSLKTDLVIATSEGNPIELVDALKRFSIPLFALKQRSLNDILRNIVSVANVLGVEERGKILYEKLNTYINEKKIKWTDKEAKKSILFILWTRPFVTIGKRCYINEIIELSKLKSATESFDNEWVYLNVEELMKLNYGAIIYAVHKPDENNEIEQYIKKNKRFFKDVPVYAIDEEILRPSINFPDVVNQLNEIASKVEISH